MISDDNPNRSEVRSKAGRPDMIVGADAATGTPIHDNDDIANEAEQVETVPEDAKV